MPRKIDHPLYSVWNGMKVRCYTKSSKAYKDYGGRGIFVCARWLENPDGFANFVEDMGERLPGMTIERIENNGPYSPENCKWADRKTQQRNRRVTRKVCIDGVEFLAVELAEISGMKTDSIVNRAQHALSFKDLIKKEKRVFKPGLALGGIANGARQKAKTHCPKGHEYKEENTSYSPQGWRRCKTCHAQKEAQKRFALKAS